VDVLDIAKCNYFCLAASFHKNTQTCKMEFSVILLKRAR